MNWNDLEEEPDEPKQDSSCGCCKIDPNTNQRGVCICTDCKCHLRTRTMTRTHNIWSDPVFLYSALTVGMMAILFLATK
jgi:hypothetical protein